MAVQLEPIPGVPLAPESPRSRSLLERLLSSPRLLRVVVAVLRTFRPLRIGRQILVTRCADVRQVFDREDDFTLAHFNEKVMPGGPFILGMDHGPRWSLERKALERARGDPPAVWELARRFAREAVDAVRDRGEIDMVGELARPVAVRVASHHYGVPLAGIPQPGEPERPDVEQIAAWLRVLALRIIGNLNQRNGGQIHEEAAEASARLAAYLDAVIEWVRVQDRRGRGEGVPECVLTRLLRHGETPEFTRRSLMGMVSAGTETVSKASTHVIDQLLRRPEVLPEAKRAAEMALRPDAAARDRLDAIANEALRFNPVFPALRRYSPRETALEYAAGRRLRVPANRTIVILPFSAMRDPRAIEEPDAFRVDRCRDDYLHYGRGIHECLGRGLAHEQVLAIVGELLLLPGLRRAPGSRGRICYDNLAVHRLVLTFERPGT